MAAPASKWGYVWKGLLILWALLFVAGTVGEILKIPALRSVGDVKRIFLR